MPLNEILEENSAKSISQKTNIPEDKIHSLLNKEFDKLNKVHALGFVSIIEREFNTDLTALKEEIAAYHEEHAQKDTRVTVGMPLTRSRRKSKWFFLLILIALGYASWYFLTKYDKTHLNMIFPLSDESTLQNGMEEKSHIEDSDLNIINVIKQKWADVTRKNGATVTKEEVIVTENGSVESISIQEERSAATDTGMQKSEESTNIASTVEEDQNVTAEEESAESANKPEEQTTTIEKTEVFIVPDHRLWFGLINLETKERVHYSISEQFAIDVTDHAWLAATSSAPFSLDDGVEHKEFQDAKEHYFKIDRDGITELSKAEYVALGGWDQW